APVEGRRRGAADPDRGAVGPDRVAGVRQVLARCVRRDHGAGARMEGDAAAHAPRGVVPRSGDRARERGAMSAGARRGEAAGLTMVELLLAVALLSFLMLAVFQLLDRSLSLWRKAETRRGLLEEAATLSDLVARDL